MKLYVWEQVLSDYSDGIVVAFAADETAARAEVARRDSSAAEQIAALKPRVLTPNRKTPAAFIVHGGS